MSDKKALLTVVGLMLAVNLVLGLRWYYASHSAKSPSVCVNNLRQIGAAKERWATEHSKTTNDVPTMDDIRPYLKNDLVCPQGGTYSPGRIGEPPTCSIGGPEHTFPAN